MQNIRDHIYQQVQTTQPFDQLEKEHKADILDWIESGADIFRIKKPDTPAKHLVAYFVLVDLKQRSILLIDHIKAQLWLPTGGHVWPNEDPNTTVIREANEELRIKASFLHNHQQPFFITCNKTGGLTPGHTDVSLWYLLRGNKFEFIDYDKSEFTDIEWFTFEEILEMDPVIFDRHLQRFVKKLVYYYFS